MNAQTKPEGREKPRELTGASEVMTGGEGPNRGRGYSVGASGRTVRHADASLRLTV